MASLGQALREEREARNISIEEIASATKIVSRYLEALESDHLDMMPGGFFIRGIIRTYAKAIGLDGDEVLARYRAAGLIGEDAPKRTVIPKAALAIGSAPPPPPAPPVPEPPAADAVVDIGLSHDPGAGETPGPAFVFETPPRPGLSPAAKRRIFALAWRVAAAGVIIAAIFFLWSSRRPRLPQGQVAASGSASAPSAGPAAMLATEPATAPAARPDLPPVAEEVWEGVTIEISFQAETWIEVRADGVLKVSGLFPAGATARARADGQLLINVGNAGGFTFLLNGKPAKPLGRTGQVRTEIAITPENYKDFLEGPSPGQPAG